MSYKCEIVADSKNTFGNRITTFLITIPRIVLAELNTHRMFTRNSASSRAIPFKKQLRSVWKHPFIPIRWMKDHSGMQGTEYFDKGFKVWLLRNLWLTARLFAMMLAWLLNKAGLTKQLCNRILEPFCWHTVLVTATDFENYFSLRANEAAEIHIDKIAYLMLEQYNSSTPVQLNEGEWHIPYLDKIVSFKLVDTLQKANIFYDDVSWIQYVIKISVAMCARTSYTVVGEDYKKLDYIADIKLHDRLAASGHWSPFEHVAKPMNNEEYTKFTRTQPIGFEKQHDLSGESINKWDGQDHRRVVPSHGMDIGVEYGWCGNFQGFIQYRKYFPNENRKDSRVLKNISSLEMNPNA